MASDPIRVEINGQPVSDTNRFPVDAEVDAATLQAAITAAVAAAGIATQATLANILTALGAGLPAALGANGGVQVEGIAGGVAVPVTLPLEGQQVRQTARTSAALPAAGAYDAAPSAIACATMSAVAIYTTYTRGGAGGSVRLRIEVSPYTTDTAGVENWFSLSQYMGAVLAAGSDSNSSVQRETLLYTATGATAENVVYGPIELGGTVARIRVAAAEVGNVGAPGTCHIVMLFQGRA